jgi:hypothetical protein
MFRPFDPIWTEVGSMTARVAPATPLLALVRGAFFGVATATVLQLRSDADLWGHTRYGLDALAAVALPSTDPYSFTSDRPWINHEWLTEAMMGAAYRAGGSVGLTLLAVAIALSAVALARWSLHRSDLSDWSVELLSAAVFLLGVAPLAQTLRPQTVSALLFILLLALLREHDRGNRRAIAAMPVLFLAWANLHGAWVMAGGVFAIWTLVRLIEAPSNQPRLRLASVAIAAAAATLINPYGIGLWRFLAETVRFERTDIIEWAPVTAIPVMLVPWTLAAGITLLALVRFRRENTAYLLMCVFLAVASFRVVRLIPFFSLAAAMLLAPALGRSPAVQRARLDRRGWVAAAVIWMVCVLSSSGDAKAGCLRPTPSLNVDEQGATFLRENGITGRLLVWFDWGEYVTWHFGPNLKVSMDGRRETVYSASLLAAHNAFYRNAPGARAFLERVNPDYVWLPKSLPVSSQISGWGWTPILETESSIIWSRANEPRVWRQPLLSTPSCFPFA